MGGIEPDAACFDFPPTWQDIRRTDPDRYRREMAEAAREVRDFFAANPE